MSTDRNGARLITLSLAATAAGFLGASLDRGAGPRTVNGSLTLGPFYLPPLLMALVCLGVAALTSLHLRHSIAAGVVLAAVLLVGSATIGSAAVSYRVSHPTHPIGFIEDWLQLLGEATALLPAVFIAARHSLRQRTQPRTKRPARPSPNA